MTIRRAGIAVFLAGILVVSIGFARGTGSAGATVHEWGTFTSVADVDGSALQWLPLGGPTDLPCFVKHVRMSTVAASPFATTGAPNPVFRDTSNRTTRPTTTSIVTKGEVATGLIYRPLAAAPAASGSAAPTFEEARKNLWGAVRMETPVIYFYSPEPYDARVTVRFPRGVITEFYPAPENDLASFNTVTLRNPQHVHTVNWNVSVVPKQAEVYPNGGEASHYYAARQTDASPLRVGAESEKFIFYRGVANFDVPIKALVGTNDSVVVVNAMGRSALPAVILFENRGGRMGFRSVGAVEGFATIAKPVLTSNVAAIRAELHKVLVRGGLYPKEATAMLDTWRDSWFEEGSRVFYLLPPEKVDAVLPLQITPAPAAVSRVFIGRVELIDRATTDIVARALEANDAGTLEHYARFLHPITDRIIARGADYATAQRISAVANAAYAKYNRDLRVCE